eukprot:gene2645-537_t
MGHLATVSSKATLASHQPPGSSSNDGGSDSSAGTGPADHAGVQDNTAASKMAEHSVHWDEYQVLGSKGGMPIGNGDVAANVWYGLHSGKDGRATSSDVVMHIAKQDAYSEFGKILKLMQLRLRVTPAMALADSPEGLAYTQSLHLPSPHVRISAGAPGGDSAVFYVWADANENTIQYGLSNWPSP